MHPSIVLIISFIATVAGPLLMTNYPEPLREYLIKMDFAQKLFAVIAEAIWGTSFWVNDYCQKYAALCEFSIDGFDPQRRPDPTHHQKRLESG
jgi:hypothetical protein